MVEVLSKLFSRLPDPMLCGVLVSALDDCPETNHTIETIRMAWIPNCDVHAGQEHYSYMTEFTNQSDLDPSEFPQVFSILESMGTLEKYRPPLQIDETLLAYAGERYGQLKAVACLPGKRKVPREIELECWLLQSNFGRHLIDAMATLARDFTSDLSIVTRAVYQEIKRRMLPVDTLDIDMYFVPGGAMARTNQSTVGDDVDDSLEITEEQPEDIVYGVWDVGLISPLLREYKVAALNRNGDALKEYYVSSQLYNLLLRTLAEPAGVVFERNAEGLPKIFAQLAEFWEMTEAAGKGRVLWDAWQKERLSGHDQLMAYKQTRRLHASFYESIFREKFVDAFVKRALRRQQ